MIQPQQPFENQNEGEFLLTDLLIIFRRRVWIIAVMTALCLLLGIFLALRPRKYSAEGQLRVQPGTASMYRSSPLSALSGQAEDQISSEVSILQSRTLYLRVAKDLDLVHRPEFLDQKLGRRQTLDDAGTRNAMAKAMAEKIAVTHKPKDEMISLSCSTNSPELSERVVNTLINDYIEYLYQLHYGSSQRASSWLMGQLDDLRKQIETDQTAITDLQGKLGVIGFDEKDSDYLFAQSLNSMTKAASDAQIDRIVAEAKYRFLQDSDPNLIEGEINLLTSSNTSPTQPNGLLQNLRNTRATLASNYSRLRAQFGPNYPDAKEAKAQLDEIDKQVEAEQARIMNQAKLSFHAASENERLTEGALQQKKKEAFSLHSEMVRYVILLHDYESHRTLYEGLILRLREAGITAGLEGGEVDVVDLADLPTVPEKPGPKTFLTGSLAGGILLGCIFAVLAESFDTRISSVEVAERITNLPLLAIIPHLDEGKGANGVQRVPIQVPNADSAYSEALRSLRSVIMLSGAGHRPQVLLVTSSIPNEGKSTTSMNLARTLAEDGSKVILIDCDLRKGSLAYKLSLDGKQGLATFLSQPSDLKSLLQTTSLIPNVDILVSGPRPPQPAILVRSEEMRRLLAECRNTYDFIVLDSPPSLGISDPVSLGNLSDAVLLIVRSELANRRVVERSVRGLMATQLPVIGFALNDVRLDLQGYGYGYNSYNAGYYGVEKS